MNKEDTKCPPENGGLNIVKVRNVVSKLVNDSDYLVVLDDDNVNDMIKDLMSEEMIDKDGNKHRSASMSCGNTIVAIIDSHLEKFQEVMKNIPPQKLQEVKEQARKAIQKDPLLGTSLDSVGIDIDNFENYLGTVEVLTIERRRVYNVFLDDDHEVL